VVDPAGRLYVGSSDGGLYALNGSTGSQLWTLDTNALSANASFAAPASISASPAIASDGTLFIGNSLGIMMAVGAPVFSTAPSPPPGGAGAKTSSSASETAKLSAGAIAAAVIFSVIGFGLLVGGIAWLVRRSQSREGTRERSSTAAALELARLQQGTRR